ncbi:MAG: LysO family transporter [Paludibacteraceae bacterium]
MFIVLGCMLTGIVVGYLLRNKRIRFLHGAITLLVWLLLFLLGWEIGTNKMVVAQFGELGLEAFIIAVTGTLGSIVGAKFLWNSIRNKRNQK